MIVKLPAKLRKLRDLTHLYLNNNSIASLALVDFTVDRIKPAELHDKDVWEEIFDPQAGVSMFFNRRTGDIRRHMPGYRPDVDGYGGGSVSANAVCQHTPTGLLVVCQVHASCGTPHARHRHSTRTRGSVGEKDFADGGCHVSGGGRCAGGWRWLGCTSSQGCKARGGIGPGDHPWHTPQHAELALAWDVLHNPHRRQQYGWCRRYRGQCNTSARHRRGFGSVGGEQCSAGV